MTTTKENTLLPIGLEVAGPNECGYYGKFGGAYIPEMLHPNVEVFKDKVFGNYGRIVFSKGI